MCVVCTSIYLLYCVRRHVVSSSEKFPYINIYLYEYHKKYIAIQTLSKRQHENTIPNLYQLLSLQLSLYALFLFFSLANFWHINIAHRIVCMCEIVFENTLHIALASRTLTHAFAMYYTNQTVFGHPPEDRMHPTYLSWGN